VKVTAIDLSTTRTYNISLVRLPVFYTSGARDVLEPNRGPWPTTGVSLGSTQFINLGLQGVGRVSASSKDTTASATGPTSNTGESIGSISDMQITSFANNGDGTFTGTLQTLPDRGYNATVTPPLPAPPVNIFSNYAARLNTFNFTFTPYTGAGPAPQNQIALSFAGSTRFTYDHDGLPGTPPVFSTGLLANGPATTLFGTVVPVAAGDTTQSDGTVTNRLTLDTEGIIFDTRPGKDGTGWVSDEYGAFIYHFNAAKQLDGQLQLPSGRGTSRPTRRSMGAGSTKAWRALPNPPMGPGSMRCCRAPPFRIPGPETQGASRRGCWFMISHPATCRAIRSPNT
jgi:hypothetical protein